MNKKRLIIPLFLLILLLIPISISYYSFQSQQISNAGAKEFAMRLEEAVSHGKTFKISELTSLDWDKIYVFHPYVSKSDMEEITQVSWTTNHSYFGYLLDRMFLGKYPLDDDSLNKLVFTKDGRVVLDVTLNRSAADFSTIQEIWHDKEPLLAAGEDGKSVVISNL